MSEYDAKDQQATVEETVLDLDGDDLTAITDALNGVKLDTTDFDQEFTTWETSLKDDIDKLCGEQGVELFRMIMVIQLDIRRAVTDSDGKESGLDRKWYRQLNPANKARIEEQGGRRLRDVRGFGRNTALEGYFALGVSWLTLKMLPKLSEDQLHQLSHSNDNPTSPR